MGEPDPASSRGTAGATPRCMTTTPIDLHDSRGHHSDEPDADARRAGPIMLTMIWLVILVLFLAAIVV